MKKLSVLVWVFVMVLSTSQIIFADDAMEVVYVSSLGDEENDGHSESTAKKELSKALLNAALNVGLLGKSTKIVIIGALDAKQDELSTLMRQAGREFIYSISSTSSIQKDGPEIIITGKPNASETEKARLSADGFHTNSGGGVIVFFITGQKVRFEHIEISGGSSDVGAGLYITGGAEVTLGEGASIERNDGRIGSGVYVDNKATFILAGGEVKNNTARDDGSNNAGGCGVFVAENAVFIMDSGIISDNILEGGNGAGVYVEAGSFIMNGGNIGGNTSTGNGAGVYVGVGSFIMNGGTISSNTSKTPGAGVFVYGGSFTLNDGSIRDNDAGLSTVGGVFVKSGATFNMNAGSIIGNRATRAGGIFIEPRASFNWKGGDIRNNIVTTDYPNVYIDQDAIYQRN